MVAGTRQAVSKSLQEIRKQIDAFVDAYNRRDIDGVLRAWGPYLVDIPDQLPTLRGAEALARRRDNLNMAVAGNDGFVTIEPHAFVPLGDAAVLVHGSFTVRLRARATGRITVANRRFMEVWCKNSHGDWAIGYEMSNGDPEAPNQA